MQRWLGIGFLSGSAVAYSMAGFFTRLIPLDVMSLLCWRSIIAGIMLTVLVLLRYRGDAWRQTRAIGRTGLTIACMGSFSSYLYLTAFRHTTVADVAIIYATLPFMTAALAWVFLAEREGWRVLVSSLLALVGVAVMARGALHAGHILGDLLAVGMTATFAVTMVLLRRGGRQGSMMPAVAVMCIITAVATAPFAHFWPLDTRTLVYLGLFGTCQLGLGLLFLSLGMRHVTATQGALLGLLDTPLAPLWVWLGFGEVPPSATLIGGAIVMLAVLWTVMPTRKAAVAPA
ncbi:DMT family transporter [Acidisoma cellulosilytica]|uniref:DMT family transporter n=1 Tax=Acidisoma cellulosilyticum TaxID=2802395 RepID=A0A963Z3I4_9PROT|nr:DMT family transporter [Acidisoma cellulosilyticum]MCB8881844.1 DMT family transporter [Acidisoma cellulosilyticum]